jgi:hypothetical protein
MGTWNPGPRTSADKPESGGRTSISVAQGSGCVSSIHEVSARTACWSGRLIIRLCDLDLWMAELLGDLQNADRRNG